jgi:ATP-dependent Lhr-like helicase
VRGAGIGIAALSAARERIVSGAIEPHIDASALDGLKFSIALPDALARATVGERTTDVNRAASVLGERMVVRSAAAAEEGN